VSDSGHRLPVVRLATPLHEIKLEACGSPRGLRERPQPLERITKKLQFLQQSDHDLVYIGIDIYGKRGLALRMAANAPRSG